MDYLNTTRSVINHVLDNSESLGNSNVNSSDFPSSAKSAESEVGAVNNRRNYSNVYEQTEEVTVAAAQTAEASVTVDEKAKLSLALT